MKFVSPPAMLNAQRESWFGLLDLAERIPDGWTLIGGQMVHLHCWDRKTSPSRATDDIDAVLDIRMAPKMLEIFTGVLLDLGFKSAGRSFEGHEHRWIRGAGILDVLIATGLGEKADTRTGVTGGTTLATSGGQGALDRSVKYEISIGDRTGIINSPTLIGAILVKAAAYLNTRDSFRDRHLQDIAVLSTLIEGSDALGLVISKNEKSRAISVIAHLDLNVALISTVPGSKEGLQRLKLLLS